jgi:hypothetical protein
MGLVWFLHNTNPATSKTEYCLEADDNPAITHWFGEVQPTESQVKRAVQKFFLGYSYGGASAAFYATQATAGATNQGPPSLVGAIGPAGPQGSPGTIVSVGVTPPTDPETNDLWVDIS